MLNKFEKLVNLLIIEKSVEIVIVFGLLAFSMIAWNSFSLGISASNVTTIDEYKMNFKVYNHDSEDIIYAENPYYFRKNYQISLALKDNDDLNNTTLVLNDKKYNLNDFYCEKERDEQVCLIIQKEINNNSDRYSLKLNIDKNKVKYHYIFEENNNF